MQPGKSFLRSIAPFIPFLIIGLGWLLTNNAWVTLLGYHLGLLGVLLLARQTDTASKLSRGGQPVLMVLTILAGAAAGILLFVLYPALGIEPGLGGALARSGLSGLTWPPFILYYSLVNPCLEEWYWRGYLGGPDRRPTISDVCYAGYHPIVLSSFMSWPWLILEFLVLLGAAWLWRQIAHRTGGLLIPLLSHLSADAGLILAIYLLAAR